MFPLPGWVYLYLLDHIASIKNCKEVTKLSGATLAADHSKAIDFTKPMPVWHRLQDPVAGQEAGTIFINNYLCQVLISSALNYWLLPLSIDLEMSQVLDPRDSSHQ